MGKGKNKNPGRNIQWGEARSVQQLSASLRSVCVAAQPGGSLESDSVVRGSCRTSERVKGREGGQQHCAVEMSHH